MSLQQENTFYSKRTHSIADQCMPHAQSQGTQKAHGIVGEEEGEEDAGAEEASAGGGGRGRRASRRKLCQCHS